MVTIEAQALRAAIACVGVNDLRTQINFVYLDPDGDVVSTNGYVMVVTKTGADFRELKHNLIQFSASAIPAWALFVTLDFDRGIGQAHSAKKTSPPFAFTVADPYTRFPEWRRVLQHGPLKATDEIGIAPKYCALVHKVFGKTPGVKMELRGPENPVVFTDQKTFLVIMPCRL